MKEKFIWEEQLQKFKESYVFPKTGEQYINYLQKQSIKFGLQEFIPHEAKKLYTYENNNQYHLNGRSIFGILRKWFAEKTDNGIRYGSGCSINTGLIQSDHSEFMLSGMQDIFIEAKDLTELLDTAKHLLSLTNEEMIAKFNITSPLQRDIATLFNAIVLDPIIDYEVGKDNFGGYSHCWNDSNLIDISTKNNEQHYSIELQSSIDRDKLRKQMILKLPNGENVVYRINFNNKLQNQYTIEDLYTEIVEVNGTSEIIQKVVAQIERFSERKLDQVDSIKPKAITPFSAASTLARTEGALENIGEVAKIENTIVENQNRDSINNQV